MDCGNHAHLSMWAMPNHGYATRYLVQATGWGLSELLLAIGDRFVHHHHNISLTINNFENTECV